MAREVPAVWIDDRELRRATPGAYQIRHIDGVAQGLAFTCPCGCGRDGYLPFNPKRSESWEWDGDLEAPTLRPSVQQVGGCGWHGYLTGGVWRSC